MIPLVLELDEKLKEGETMVGIKTIELSEAPNTLIGYVAIIKTEGLNYRYGSLRAYRHGEKGNVL